MKVEYINPFVRSTVKTFETMLALKPERGEPYVGKDPKTAYEITAVIGLSGDAKGTVVLNFPRAVAQAAVGRFLGDSKTLPDQDLADGVGELVNIIAGGAKADLSETGLSLQLSLPTVVMGAGHLVWQGEQVPYVVIPFKSVIGEFSVQFSLKTK